MWVLGLLLFSGVIITRRWTGRQNLADLVSYSLLFAIALIPWTAVVITLILGRRLDFAGIVWPAVLITVSLVFLEWRQPTMWASVKVRTSDIVLLVLGAGIGALTWHLHADADLLLSLFSYLEQHDASCFPFLTLNIIADIGDLQARPFYPLNDFYRVICTPANVVFTAPLTVLIGPVAFRVMDVLARGLLVVFVGRLVEERTEQLMPACVTAAFSAICPLILSIEVLDRNVIALMLSAGLFHHLQSKDSSPSLGGWLFGLTVGTGLRFLPVLLLCPIIAHMVATRATRRTLTAFFLLTIIGAALNVPHLFFHGLHRLGEREPIWELAFQALTRAERTPFIPWPTGIALILNGLSAYGLVFSSIGLCGFIRAVKGDRFRSIGWTVYIAIALVVLSIQRDWIEGQLARIPVFVQLPLLLWIGDGLHWVRETISNHAISRRKMIYIHKLLILLLLMSGLWMVTKLLRAIEAPPDLSMATRKPTYQYETPLLASFLREQTFPVHFWPAWERHAEKLNVARKRAVDRAIRVSITKRFPRIGSMISESWVSWLTINDASPDRPQSLETCNVRIELESLVSGNATLKADESEPFIDLTDRPNLADLYYMEVSVGWQFKPLTIAIMPLREEDTAIGRLTIELNAFKSIGMDRDGFERVVPINEVENSTREMRAVPISTKSLVLRAPCDTNIILRYWIIALTTGRPYRVDSWSFESANPTTKASFYFGEPESYL